MSAIIQRKGDVFGPNGAVAGNIPVFDGTTGKIIKDGKIAPAGTIVGTTDTQTLSAKTLTDPVFSTAGYSFRSSGVLVCNAANVSAPAGGAGADIFNFSVPAGLLSRDGDLLRITLYRVTTTTTGSKMIRVFWGGTQIYIVDNTSTTAVEDTHTVIISRFGAANQRIIAYRVNTSTICNTETSTATANLSAANVLLAQVWATSAGAAASRLGMVEFLPVP